MPDSHDAVGAGSSRKGPPPISSPEALRRRADEIANANASKQSDELSPAAAQEVIHSLRVHQIELELQNEELRRAQEALELARARYFDLYDLAPVSYFTIGENGLILEVNLTGAQLLGVSREVLVNQPLSLFILPEDQDRYYLASRQLATTGDDHGFELRMAKTDGRPFWVWIQAAMGEDEEGTPVWRMVMTDITYRKTAEQAMRTADSLRDSWTYYRQIAEALPQLVWTSGADGTWEYVGPQWMRYTGFPEAEQLGLGWARQLHPDDRPAVLVEWNRAVAAGTMFDGEFRIRRYDGIFRRFKWRAVPLRSEAGVVTKWFGTCTDMDDPEVAEEIH